MKKFYKKKEFDYYPLLFTYFGNIRNGHNLIGIEKINHRIHVRTYVPCTKRLPGSVVKNNPPQGNNRISSLPLVKSPPERTNCIFHIITGIHRCDADRCSLSRAHPDRPHTHVKVFRCQGTRSKNRTFSQDNTRQNDTSESVRDRQRKRVRERERRREKNTDREREKEIDRERE